MVIIAEDEFRAGFRTLRLSSLWGMGEQDLGIRAEQCEIEGLVFRGFMAQSCGALWCITTEEWRVLGG